MIFFIGILINDINTSTINTESTTTQLTYEKAAEEEIEKIINPNDIFQLNVGGEILQTTRETLTRIPNSILSIMFNGQWENKLEKDKNENIFLDFNPIIFRYLLDQLQLFNINNISLPSNPLRVIPFKKMIRKLGLNHLLLLEKKIINFNVNGQIITNQRETFSHLSNSIFNNQTDEFIDYHPKLFRHLIKQLRAKTLKNISSSNELSFQEKFFITKMLFNFKINHLLFRKTTTIFFSIY